MDGNGETSGTGDPAAGEKQINRVAHLRCIKGPMPLGLKTVVATIHLARKDVDALLCIALSPVSHAVLDIAIERCHTVAETLEVLPRQRAERQLLDSRDDGKLGRYRVGWTEYRQGGESRRRSWHLEILALRGTSTLSSGYQPGTDDVTVAQ